MKTPERLNKEEFIERIASWAAKCGFEFSETRLDEWIKQKLAFGANRGKNFGRRPTHWYGCRHYRRALQLFRFYTAGIKDTDELRVRLFVNGYAAPSVQLRKSLLIEFRKARSQLNSPIRSTYADGNRDVPPGRMRQLSKQLGPLDPRFEAADIVLPNNLVLSALRAGRDPTEIQSRTTSSEAGRRPEDSQKQLLAMAQELNRGMLAQDEEFPTDIERLIGNAGDHEYNRARTIFANRHGAAHLLAKSNDEGMATAFGALLIAFQQREAIAFLLVVTLRQACGKLELSGLPDFPN